jgi:hypothetical protein
MTLLWVNHAHLGIIVCKQLQARLHARMAFTILIMVDAISVLASSVIVAIGV